MKRNIGLDPLAVTEMQTTFDYYEEQQIGLGDDFITEVDDSFELISIFPDAFPIKYKQLRGYVLPKFPFIIFYNYTDTEIRIVSIFHTSRKRNY